MPVHWDSWLPPAMTLVPGLHCLQAQAGWALVAPWSHSAPELHRDVSEPGDNPGQNRPDRCWIWPLCPIEGSRQGHPAPREFRKLQRNTAALREGDSQVAPLQRGVGLSTPPPHRCLLWEHWDSLALSPPLPAPPHCMRESREPAPGIASMARAGAPSSASIQEPAHSHPSASGGFGGCRVYLLCPCLLQAL